MNYKFIVKEIEGEKVLLQDEEGQEFVWPKFKLPEGVILGQEIYFNIDNKINEGVTPENLLKEILHI